MTKKFSKVLLTLLLIVVTISSFSVCFAEVGGETTKSAQSSESDVTTISEDNEEDSTVESDEIHNGDLYLFEKDIVMDKLVDGNVFIFGNNVEVTGQVNGNLFVFANNVKFNECYIRYSIFACANSVYYNGACNDLYTATKNLEMTYDSYVIRDVKAAANDVIFQAAIGRDVDLHCKTVNFGDTESAPIIYGNLRYSAENEVSIPEGTMASATDSDNDDSLMPVTYSNSVSTVVEILLGFITCIVTVFIICFLISKSTPKFAEKITTQKITVKSILMALLIGILSALTVFVAVIILLFSVVGTKLAILVALIYALLVICSVPALTMNIATVFKSTLKVEGNAFFYLILALISIVLYGINYIPVVGIYLSLLISFISIGLLISAFFPHKEITQKEQDDVIVSND